MIINNKIKQFFCGNWGKPSSADECHKIDLSVFDDTREPRFPSKKKKSKKAKKPYVYEGHLCAFCGIELPEDELKKEQLRKEYEGKLYRPWELTMGVKVTTCPKCGSYKVSTCPACKRSTWFNPISRVFKHQSRIMGCGFEGVAKT